MSPLNEYISQARQYGLSNDQIIEKLMAEGWSHKQVTEALYGDTLQPPHPPNITPTMPTYTASPSQDQNTNKLTQYKIPLLIFFNLLFIITVSGVAYSIYNSFSDNKNSSSPVANNIKSNSSDCGTVTVTNETFNNSPFNDCFNKNFTNCEPGTITVENKAEFLAGTINKYEIQSAKDDKCMVTWQYLSLPSNPGWNNKTITCGYDNSIDFFTALQEKQDYEGCSGPLLEVIQS